MMRIEELKRTIKNRKLNHQISETDGDKLCNNVENSNLELSFEDLIGIPFKIWGEKIQLLERERSHLQRVLKKTSRKGKYNRIKNEITLKYDRQAAIRKEIQQYMARINAFLIKRYEPKIIAFEDLSHMSPRHKTKPLAKIISQMIKRIDPITTQVHNWIDLPNDQFKVVDAKNTSKIYFHCEKNPKAHLNRSENWNYGKCPNTPDDEICIRCKAQKIHINTHFNAAYNIAEKAIALK